MITLSALQGLAGYTLRGLVAVSGMSVLHDIRELYWREVCPGLCHRGSLGGLMSVRSFILRLWVDRARGSLRGVLYCVANEEEHTFCSGESLLDLLRELSCEPRSEHSEPGEISDQAADSVDRGPEGSR